MSRIIRRLRNGRFQLIRVIDGKEIVEVDSPDMKGLTNKSNRTGAKLPVGRTRTNIVAHVKEQAREADPTRKRPEVS